VYRVFVDTNVIFEHALKQRNWQQCMDIFKMAETGRIECYASAASFFTLAYFIRKEKAPKEILNGYLSFIHPLPTYRGVLDAALASDFTDIEDGFQYFTALHETDCFVTLNIKDFERFAVAGLPCMTPDEFLRSETF